MAELSSVASDIIRKQVRQDAACARQALLQVQVQVDASIAAQGAAYAQEMHPLAHLAKQGITKTEIHVHIARQDIIAQEEQQAGLYALRAAHPRQEQVLVKNAAIFRRNARLVLQADVLNARMDIKLKEEGVKRIGIAQHMAERLRENIAGKKWKSEQAAAVKKHQRVTLGEMRRKKNFLCCKEVHCLIQVILITAKEIKPYYLALKPIYISPNMCIATTAHLHIAAVIT